VFCPFCGAAKEDDARFCGRCGAVLPEDTDVEVARSEGVDPGWAEPLCDAGSVWAAPEARPRAPKAPRSWPRVSGNARTWSIWLVVAAGAIALLAVSAHFLTAPTRVVTNYETVLFETDRQSDNSLLEGVEYTETSGQTGTKQVRTKEWLDSDGFVENRKVVGEAITVEPASEVVVRGARSAADTGADVTAVATEYVRAWRAGDYAAMLAQCTSDSLGGGDLATVVAACAAAAETVGVANLDAPLVSGMQQLLAAEQSGQSDDRLTASDYPFDSMAVAFVPAYLEIASPALGSRTSEDGIRLTYTPEGWKVIYEGPLAVIRVDQTQTYSTVDWGDTETGSVTLEQILIYADHVLLVVSETNTIRSEYGSSSIYSQFRNLDDEDTPVMSDDSMAGASYTVDTERSSDYYEVEEGVTQRGVIYVEPGLTAEATLLHVRLADVSFLNIQVPAR
jgi:hypothetical protein